MASMDDLIATMSGVHAGQQGRDLKDLHAKLQQTIPSQPYYRPIPPPASSSAIPPHSSSSGGPLPPPAPASSWNTPSVIGQNISGGANSGFGAGAGQGAGVGTSPLRQGGWQGQIHSAFGSSGSGGMGGGGKSGGSASAGGVPGPKQVQVQGGRSTRNTQEGDGARPYHNNVLPVRASPKDTGGFEQDAFKPLWQGKAGGAGQGQGQQARYQEQEVYGGGGGGGDWGGFTGERL
ncbi:uncharacterized protein MKK02DRAFT_41632 [Dioszegia hungarica]|uniref:Uncharacterized protein n=1 Tax=Dioszegia hungarica TaxID=4972 RepID=A0AA38H3E7_9TREE|nr:uncharacterized protein MKK02DRAFT_41632 [Dioszegia hungarica]KAI9631991.1 hypothetical protein MKK02DRAFT_41632 [Dioszegia hungarica]